MSDRADCPRTVRRLCALMAMRSADGCVPDTARDSGEQIDRVFTQRPSRTIGEMFSGLGQRLH